MNSFSIWHWLIVVLLIGLVVLIKKGAASGQTKSRDEDLRVRKEHFQSTIAELGPERLSQMTVSELQDLLNKNSNSDIFNTRYLIAMVSSHQLILKDFDSTKSYEERTKERELKEKYGEKKPNIVCQHCQTKGFVRVKKGLKAVKTQTTGLGPLNSVLLPKSETKFDVTYFRCENCDMDWEVK